ncbi:Proteasome subunit beta type-3 [Castilleja foliolosa]|uniref:Proteasome subunit beta type-3 n=1 Tax=Castilleja foliolosa TaxID=1961234 RepID=A0ABD3DPB2_9LAMI
MDAGENNDGQPAPSNHPVLSDHPGPSDPPVTSDQPNQLVKPISARRPRKPTRMAKLTLRYPAILEKFEIFFVDGEKEVEYSQAEVKLQEKFKQKWVNYVGRRWAAFKTNLTTTFIYGKKKDEPPYVKEYEFLDKETWEASVASRLTQEEKAKRLRAQKIQGEKRSADDPSQIIQLPSPPSRHKTWKRARITKSGDYINEETSYIAAKIDALKQEQSSGNFTPSGRSDILAVAIGKPDHPSRVRGVGKGYTVRTYFGKQECAANGMVSREEVAAIVAEIQAKLRAQMQMILTSQSTSAAEPHTPVVLSAKGSCVVGLGESDKQNGEDGDDIVDYELYVEDPHKRLVAYGLIHDLGSNLHNRKMNKDEVRVSVERVVVADGPVPFPTEEVNKVGELLKSLLLGREGWWSRTSNKRVSQRELFPSPVVKDTEKDVLKVLWIEAVDIKKPKNCCIEAEIVSLTRAYVSINQMDIMGLLAAGMISVPVMIFYNKCLYNILVSSGRADKYGLMCLLAIQSHGNNEEMGLIRNRIGE